MGSKGKYGAQLNVQIPPELKRDLEKFAVNNQQKIKNVVADALANYFVYQEAKK
jgi:predicted transcriptional regulator